jgi:hypothetical protein
VQPELDPHARAIGAGERGQPAGQTEAQTQERRVLDDQRSQQRVAPLPAQASPAHAGHQVGDHTGHHRCGAGAVRGRHLRVADPKPVRAVGRGQPTGGHQSPTGGELLVALSQAALRGQAVEQQQAQLLIGGEVLAPMLGTTRRRARLDHRSQVAQLNRQPTSHSTGQPDATVGGWYASSWSHRGLPKRWCLAPPSSIVTPPRLHLLSSHRHSLHAATPRPDVFETALG